MNNKMNLSNHCLIRCKQRGIKQANIELIMSFGSKIRKPGGVFEYYISKKDKQEAIQFLKQCIQNLDKLYGKAIIVDETSEKIITIYHKTQ